MNNIELFFKIVSISILTFGGGYQAIPFFKKNFVDNKLIDEKDFLQIIKTEALIPGSVGLNLALLIGQLTNGNIGLLIVSIAWILPSVIIILLFYKFLIYSDNKYYKSFIKGITLCTLALVINTLIYLINSIDLINIKNINVKNIINFFLLALIVYLLYSNFIDNYIIILISGITFILIDIFV